MLIRRPAGAGKFSTEAGESRELANRLGEDAMGWKEQIWEVWDWCH